MERIINKKNIIVFIVITAFYAVLYYSLHFFSQGIIPLVALTISMFYIGAPLKDLFIKEYRISNWKYFILFLAFMLPAFLCLYYGIQEAIESYCWYLRGVYDPLHTRSWNELMVQEFDAHIIENYLVGMFIFLLPAKIALKKAILIQETSKLKILFIFLAVICTSFFVCFASMQKEFKHESIQAKIEDTIHLSTLKHHIAYKADIYKMYFEEKVTEFDYQDIPGDKTIYKYKVFADLKVPDASKYGINKRAKHLESAIENQIIYLAPRVIVRIDMTIREVYDNKDNHILVG